MRLTSCAFFTATFAGLLMATGAQADDPPLRVGRIGYLEGTVSFHAGDENDWSYATLNYPVVSGNSFWTDPDGRSDIQIGSVEIRMDHSTEMDVLQLDENHTQLEVPQGVVNIHFSTPPINGSVEVMTPVGPIELTHPGTYHIDSGQPPAPGVPGTHAQVTALEGQLDIRGQNSLLEVMTGETALLNGNPPSFSLQEAVPTPFDDWALVRERREEAHYAAQYLSPHTTGYEDLDYNGQWAADPTYGNVWYPTAVQADWAPYRYGHWAYITPWGWTWVDDAPWGFAPFHYGRWAYIGNRWGWVPGTVVERPVYAPALVAFVGGAGWSVSLSIGGATPAVGWVPLGPREVFHPYYPVSLGYARNVNIANVNRTEINNITINNIHNVNVTNYANSRAATVVSAQSFQQGQPVHKSLVQVSASQLAHAPVTPTLEHLAPANAARNEGHPMPSSMQGRMPNPGVEAEVKRIGESPSASPINRMPASPEAPHRPEAEAPQAPQQPHAPQSPQIVHVQPQETQAHNNVPAPHGGGEPKEHSENRAPGHAPGPQIRPMTPELRQQKIATFEAPKHSAPPPPAKVPHPQQQTHITPTPQGWQRTPAQPHEPSKPQAPHPAERREPDNR